MTPDRYSTKTILLILWKAIVTFLLRHWLNILTILALIGLLTQKSIHMELTWEASTLFDNPIASATSTSSEDGAPRVKSLEQAFSFGNFSFSSKSSEDETKSKSSVPRTKKFPQVHHGNYWSVVLGNRTSGEHSLDPSLVASYQTICQNYIKRFAPVAVAEMRKYGIPASIKLAQALLESNAGKAALATRFHNHFGIQCFAKNCKPGHCASHADLGHKSFYRQHESAWMSYRTHSHLLSSNRYQHLKGHGTSDFRSWALGLEEAGYSADSNYAELLIEIIEHFELGQLDE